MERIYRREDYLNKIRGFYDDTMIKVITGIRRCGKSSLLKSIIEELKEKGVQDKDIIYIELDKKEYRDIKTPYELEKVIDNFVTDDDFKYLFIDEVQNVKGFEEPKTATPLELIRKLGFSLLKKKKTQTNVLKYIYFIPNM